MDIVKASGIDIETSPSGQLLLRVNFRELDNDEGAKVFCSWMPQWETIRELIKASVVVESINQRGSGKELQAFFEEMQETKDISHYLTGLFYAQFGIEG